MPSDFPTSHDNITTSPLSLRKLQLGQQDVAVILSLSLGNQPDHADHHSSITMQLHNLLYGLPTPSSFEDLV
jgi:hypothetical protein